MFELGYEDAVRENFENWYSDNGKYPKAIERSTDGTYVLMQTQTSWDAWLACAKKLRAITVMIHGKNEH